MSFKDMFASTHPPNPPQPSAPELQVLPPHLAFHTGSGDLKLVPCVCIGSYCLSHSPAHLVSAFHGIAFQDPQRHVEVSSPWSWTPLMTEPLRLPQSTEMRVTVYKGKDAPWSRGDLPWSPDCSSQVIRSFWTILQNQS